MLMCSVARADDGVPGTDAILGWQHVQASDLAGLSSASAASRNSFSAVEHNSPPPGYAARDAESAGAGPDDDAPGLAAVDRDTERMRYGPRRFLVHVDDATTASGFADSRVRTMAVALDAVVPHAGGLTIQPRVQLAYQPGNAATGTQAPDMLGDSSATGFGVRLYGAQQPASPVSIRSSKRTGGRTAASRPSTSTAPRSIRTCCAGSSRSISARTGTPHPA